MIVMAIYVVLGNKYYVMTRTYMYPLCKWLCLYV